MARWTLSNVSFTPTAVGDTANFTDNGMVALQGASATQTINVLEIYEGGQHTASAANYMIFARDVVFGAGTVTAGTNGHGPSPLHGATAALAAPPVLYGAVVTTKGQRSTTHLLNLSFNAFGGIVRWVAAPGEEITMIGNTQPLGETSLTSFTGSGSGLMSTHWIIEPF